MQKAKKPSCPYCYGHGLLKDWHDIGYRRPMPNGVKGRPAFKDPVVPCDRCGKPEPSKK